MRADKDVSPLLLHTAGWAGRSGTVLAEAKPLINLPLISKSIARYHDDHR